jgi:dihydrofolate synthase/folylpolyglutamate synthase
MVNIPHWPKIPLWSAPRKIDLNLSFELLEALGNPHTKLPPTIHVAGTNGKGSTIAMLKSIFEQAGLKVHRYTSPHLVEFNERILLAGKPITDAHLSFLLEHTKITAEKLNLEPKFFEGTTAAAFLAFSETKADILLLETGLGGRLDPTNVVPNPILTIITPISYDHTEYLGTELLQIAYEKAGIIKENTPCVIGPQTDEVYKLLLNKCEEMSAPAFCYEYDFFSKKEENGFEYLSKKFNLKLPKPNLPGNHQIENAASVVAAITLLNNKFQITAKQLTDGLTNISWPGRLQLVDKEKAKKLAGDNIEIYLDGAHNNAGAAILGDWLKTRPDTKTYLILAMTKNRDASAFCKHLEDYIDDGVVVTSLSEPLSYSPTDLIAKAKQCKINFTDSPSLTEAIRHISTINQEEPATILITGSLFLVADFLKL